MIEISRRVALAVLVVCLASPLAADSHHPDLTKSQVVTLDARTIEAYANSSKPFDLGLGETKVTVVLAPAPVWPEEGLTVVEIAKDGSMKERLVTGNITYAGKVVGQDPATTEVRITITRGVLEGYVLTGSDWWFIEPLGRFDPKAGLDQYLVYKAHDVEAAAYPGPDVKTDQVIDYTRIPTPYIPLAWVADKEYVDQSGPGFEWIDRQAALLNDINGIFKLQTGREFKSRRGVADAGGVFLTSHNHDRLLVQMVDLVNQLGGVIGFFQSDIAHLTSGKVLNNGVLSASFRRHRFALSQQATMLAVRNVIVAARGIGSNYNAGPEEAVEFCVSTPNGCIWLHTIMWPVIDNHTLPRFSDGTIDPERNNIELICAEMSPRGFPCMLP